MLNIFPCICWSTVYLLWKNVYLGPLPTLLPVPSRFSRVRLCATPRTAAYQAPPSMGFSGQQYWSRVPLLSPCPLELIFCCCCFLLLSYMSSSYIFDINCLSDVWFADFFLYFIGCLFILLMCSFVVLKLFSLM